MYICICKGITDSDIRDAVIDGANSMHDIRNRTGISTQCGQCSCSAKAVFREALEKVRSDSPLFYAA